MLMGLAHEHILMGLAHENLLMGMARKHMLMGLAHEHVLMGLAMSMCSWAMPMSIYILMEPDPGPNELKSRSGQHIRTSEFEVAKSIFLKIVRNG